jgi:hypothetical protein
MWASGKEYRRSDPHLAFVPLDRVEDPKAVRYWAGGKWSEHEADAKPLFHHPQIGELSVAWCRPLGCWLMLYNSGDPRGIVIRTAERPWGPWSEATVLFEPWRDGGYGKFIHAPDRDAVNDPGREKEYGGEYGPYLIPRFFRGERREATIYFTMSTWNPYNVVLMRARIRRIQ